MKLPVGFSEPSPSFTSSKSSLSELKSSLKCLRLVGDKSKKSPYFFGLVLFLSPLLLGESTFSDALSKQSSVGFFNTNI